MLTCTVLAMVGVNAAAAALLLPLGLLHNIRGSGRQVASMTVGEPRQVAKED